MLWVSFAEDLSGMQNRKPAVSHFLVYYCQNIQNNCVYKSDRKAYLICNLITFAIIMFSTEVVWQNVITVVGSRSYSQTYTISTTRIL